jgi:hypothetical protein
MRRLLGLLSIGAVAGAMTGYLVSLRGQLWLGLIYLAWPVVIGGAIAGALLTYLALALREPWRVSRAARIAILVSAIIWIAFWVTSPRVTAEEWARIDADRQWQEGMNIIHDIPITVAGRWHGTFGATSVADDCLTLAAAPAIDFAELLVVTMPAYGAPGRQGESYVIAALGFGLSTAFWHAIGVFVDLLIERRRRKRARLATSA